MVELEDGPWVVGNLVGGLTFVGAMIYSTHYKTGPSRKPTIESGAYPVAAE